MKTVTILGSTGSVGTQTLEAIGKHPELFKVVGLSAFSNDNLLREQLEKFNPEHYYFPAGAVEVQTSFFDLLDDPESSKCLGSLEELAALPSDIVVLAVPGIAGLWAAVTTLKRGATLAIANKETVVAAGKYLKTLEKKYGGKILPLDTEHSAVFQCMLGEDVKNIKKIILTASGGAFRDMPVSSLDNVTAEDALKHPVWKMGRKVTVDSATLFNKGLEVIEAMRLFEAERDKISVLMHRESIVHGLVELKDGGVKALMSFPSMSLAIESALFYPDRAADSVPSLDLAQIGSLHFSSPDYERYPCLKLASDAAMKGDAACIALSAADEVLVDAFLRGQVRFNDIPRVLSKVLDKFGEPKTVDPEDIMGIDGEARKYTYSIGVK